MSEVNFTELKTISLIEILNAISVCNEVEQLINNGFIEDEQLNKYHAGGLANAVNHLTSFAAMQVEWIAENSTDKQA